MPLRLASVATCSALVLAAVAPFRSASAQSLRGSPASVERMYQEARREALAFHATPNDVHAAASSGTLVALRPGRDVALKRVTFPYVTAATLAFVEQLGRQHRAACGEPLTITSAARPTTRQPRNSVAQSVHPTGMAIDLHKPKGRCLRWLRATLVDLEDAGAIEATEEFRPPHFHVAVFPTGYTRYAAGQPLAPGDRAALPRVVVAEARREAPRPTTRSIVAERVSRVSRTATRSPSRLASAPRAPRRYKVRNGDTLWDIARAHDVSVKQLLAANGMKRPKIRPGQRLVLPKGAPSTVAAQEMAVGQ